MSQLQQLMDQINQLESDAKRTANSLAGFKSQFSDAVSQVAATVGGSTTRVDRSMIETLQQAEKAVDNAVEALGQAAEAAKNYASSI